MAQQVWAPATGVHTSLPTQNILGTLQINYGAAAGAYVAAVLDPGTVVTEVRVFVQTAFTAASTSTIEVGDTGSSVSALATGVHTYVGTGDVTVTTAGGVSSTGLAQTKKWGDVYTGSSTIIATYAPDGSDAAGVLLITVFGYKLQDQQSGALESGIL